MKRRSDKGDVFNINSITSSTGGTEDYGVFDATSSTKAYKPSTAKVYGDETLAVVVFDNPNGYDKENFFIRHALWAAGFCSCQYFFYVSSASA